MHSIRDALITLIPYQFIYSIQPFSASFFAYCAPHPYKGIRRNKKDRAHYGYSFSYFRFRFSFVSEGELHWIPGGLKGCLLSKNYGRPTGLAFLSLKCTLHPHIGDNVHVFPLFMQAAKKYGTEICGAHLAFCPSCSILFNEVLPRAHSTLALWTPIFPSIMIKLPFLEGLFQSLHFLFHFKPYFDIFKSSQLHKEKEGRDRFTILSSKEFAGCLLTTTWEFKSHESRPGSEPLPWKIEVVGVSPREFESVLPSL